MKIYICIEFMTQWYSHFEIFSQKPGRFQFLTESSESKSTSMWSKQDNSICLLIIYYIILSLSLTIIVNKNWSQKFFFFFNLSGNLQTMRFCLPVIRHKNGSFWWRWLSCCCCFFLYDSLLFPEDNIAQNKDLWLIFLYFGFWQTIYFIPYTYVRKSIFPDIFLL